MTGDQLPLKTALSEYLGRWYKSLYGDTKAVKEFTERGFAHCVQWAPGRLVDQAEEILKSYQKNDNAPQGRNTLFPFVAIGMARDFTPMGADWGGRMVGRRMIRIEESGSIYGYRQAMHEVRAQIVIFAADVDSAKSLAAQLCLFTGVPENRRFKAKHTFGQYTVEMPAVLETPDPLFMNIQTEQKNITILAGDLTLKAQIPYFDAPKAGEPNDGTTNNPPGYPGLTEIVVSDLNTAATSTNTSDGTGWE